MQNKDNKNKQMVSSWSKDEVSLQEVNRWIYKNANSSLWKKFLYWKIQLNLPKAAKTIETGCGYGKFSMILGLNGEEVTLMDYNSDALNSALKAHQSIGLTPKTIEGDLIKFSYGMEGQFDIVCSFGTLEHFSDSNRLLAFQANARFMKPGGLLFFTVPNRFAVFYRIAFALRKKLGLLPKNFFEKPYSRSELKRLALSSGILPLEINCIGTLREDFKYWILENFKSLIKKLNKNEKPLTQENFDIDFHQIDLSGNKIKELSNYLDRYFSYNLLFVGKKILNP